MNFGWALMLVFVLVASVAGIYYVSSQQVSTPAVDTYGMYAGNQTNTSYHLAANATAPIGTMGVGIIVIAGIVVLIGAASLAVYVATGNKNNSRYH